MAPGVHQELISKLTVFVEMKLMQRKQYQASLDNTGTLSYNGNYQGL